MKFTLGCPSQNCWSLKGATGSMKPTWRRLVAMPFQHQLDTQELRFIGAFPGAQDLECFVQHNGAVVTAARAVRE